MKRLKLIILFLGLGFASVVRPMDGDVMSLNHSSDSHDATPNTGTGIKDDGNSNTSFDEAMNTLSDPTVPDNEDSFGYQSDDEDSRPTSPITINNDENDGASSIGAGPRVSNGTANEDAQESADRLDLEDPVFLNGDYDDYDNFDWDNGTVTLYGPNKKKITSDPSKIERTKIKYRNLSGKPVDREGDPLSDGVSGYLDVNPDVDGMGNDSAGGGYLDVKPDESNDEGGYMDPTQSGYLDVNPDEPNDEDDEPGYLDVNPDELNDEDNNVSETPYSEAKDASVNGPQSRFTTPTERVTGGSMFAPADQLISSTDAASDVDSINSGMDPQELKQRLDQIIELGVSKSRGGGKFAIDHLDDLLKNDNLTKKQRERVKETLNQYEQYIKNRRKWFFKSKLDGNAFYDHENRLTSQEKKDLKRNRVGKMKNKDALKRIRATQGSLILEDARPSDVSIEDWRRKETDEERALTNYAASDEPKNTGYPGEATLFKNDDEW